MKPEELSQLLMKLQKDTSEGKLSWRIEVQTTERNEDKYTITEEGQTWSVDECYVSYLCTYKGMEFFMITYELIQTAGKKIKTNNYIFLPPLGVRLFSLHTLLPHSIEANAVLIRQVHTLWETLIALVKQQSDLVTFRITDADERRVGVKK